MNVRVRSRGDPTWCRNAKTFVFHSSTGACSSSNPIVADVGRELGGAVMVFGHTLNHSRPSRVNPAESLHSETSKFLRITSEARSHLRLRGGCIESPDKARLNRPPPVS